MKPPGKAWRRSSLRWGWRLRPGSGAVGRRGPNIPATDSSASSDPQATSAAATAGAPVSGARVAVAHSGPAGEWQMPAGDYPRPRFNELASLTPPKAPNLHVALAVSNRVLLRDEGE